MKKLLISITAGLLLYSADQKAQVSAYSFTQTVGTYGAPNTGSFVGTNDQDDDVTPVTLPFPFVFNGVSQTTIDVCSNGYLSFNALTGSEYLPISDALTQNVISPFGNDIIMGTFITGDISVGSNSIVNCSSVAGFSVGNVLLDLYGDFASNPTITAIAGNTIVLNQNALFTVPLNDFLILNGFIKQNVSGTAPNRICEFQFVNFSRYYINQDNINFKVKLYETTNAIQFVYGANTPGLGSSSPEIGLKGSTNTDFNSRKVISPTTWSNSIASTSSSDYCEFDNLTFPTSGQSYMWMPVTCTVPIVTIAATNATICSGSSATLTGNGATSYSWTNGPATASNTVTPLAGTQFTLVGANGTCTSSATYSLVVTTTPTVTIIQSTVACPGTPVNLVASGAASYSWANNGPASATLTVSQITAATYTVYGTNGTCTRSASITHSFFPTPLLTPMYSQSTLCIGQTGTLSLSGITPGLTYTWSTGATNTSSVILTATAAPAIIASASVSNGTCQATYSFIQQVSGCTGLNDLAESVELGILAYPNPFNATFHIKNTSSEEKTVVISDGLGKVVYSTKITADSTETISSDNLKSGLYFISVKGNNGNFTKKLIKE